MTAPSGSKPLRPCAGTVSSTRPMQLVDMVRSYAAVVLGHPGPESVDAQRSFRDLGCDSRAAVEIRHLLNQATGLRMPVTAVFDHQSPRALADYMAAALGSADLADPEASHEPFTPSSDDTTDTVASVYRQLIQAGKMSTAVDLLTAATTLRDRFHSSQDLTRRVSIEKLTSGPRHPSLVCIPSLGMGFHAVQFTRLAASFRGLRDVLAVAVPGFSPGEPVPATPDAAIDVLADAIAATATARQPVLVGYSAGGFLAHSVAAALESRGTPPTAVVLLDTYPGQDVSDQFYRTIMLNVFQGGGHFAPHELDELTAINTYVEMYRQWKPDRLSTPIVLIRPTALLPAPPGIDALPDAQRRSACGFADIELTTPGDHFSMIADDAATTADCLENWLATTNHDEGADDART
jgi:pimeloyl-ACP methyl ester carboxylesterase/acyl carrier protein